MADLFKDPKGFLEGHIVKVVADNPKLGDVVAPDQLDVLEKKIGLYQVRDTDCLRYAAVVKSTQDPAIDNLVLTKTKGGTPVYYLPWNKDHAYRLELAKGAGTPDFFVTANLSGCTVVIDGDPLEPTVYHLNASSTGQSMEFLRIPQDEAKMQASATAKVAHMENVFKIARNAHPVVPKAALRANTARALDLTHYVGPTISTKAAKAILGEMQDKFGIDPLESNITAQTKEADVYDPTWIEWACWATVVGKRQTDGTWTFFCQPRGLASYRIRKVGTKGHTTADFESKSGWGFWKPFEFSPGGTAKVL